MTAWPEAVEVVDSHTEGEPTRVVLSGWPLPGGASLAERRASLLREQDHLRRAVVLEPRGHAAIVGALLTPPEQPGSQCGVVFFNNAGALGMCGHGLIGVVRTLEWLGRLQPGEACVDTPVGTVTARLEGDGHVTVRNVPACVQALDVEVDVPGLGRLHGDVAWGGNWFFVCEDHGQPLALARAPALSGFCERVKQALVRAGITGAGGAPIDHVELSDDARNFVLCPGGAYDRSPCGTGTSAKLACLAADGRLAPGETWRQRSITDSVFEARYERAGDHIIPTITGKAWVTAEAMLLADPADPLAHGIRVAP